MAGSSSALVQGREFSRKSFLRGGGALIVGFTLAGAGGRSRTAAAAYMPDRSQADAWLTIHANNTVELKTSHIDPGNRAPLGMLAIAAEELSVSLDQVRHSVWDSDVIVNSGSTG